MNPFPLRPRTLLIIGAFLIPMLFALYTGHIWEDYYITLRPGRNLAEGHGFVFTPGERLQTYTSPLGSVLPALCYCLTSGPHRELATIWLFRIVSVGCLMAAFALLWNRLTSMRVGTLGRTVALGLILLDPKLTDFSINGMETGILVLALACLWSELEREGGPRMVPLGLACSFLEWTRPDGVVLGGVMIVAHLLVRGRGQPGRLPLATLGRALVLAGLVYLPWFLFTWIYYGTPIPHTVTAKGAVSPHFNLPYLLLTPWHVLTDRSVLVDAFMPTYWVFGGWPSALGFFAYLLTTIPFFGWLIPRISPAARRLCLALFLGTFYIELIIVFPWYTPAWMVIASLSVGLLVDDAAKACARYSKPALLSLLRMAVLLALSIQACVLVAAAWQMKNQQELIEEGIRQPLGEWLHGVIKPGEAVFLEPLGYVGYFSNAKTYDVPGLSSTEVVAVEKQGHLRLTEIITALRPTWLVLRPSEVANATLPENAALREYREVATWNMTDRLAAVPMLPGRAWLENDQVFYVFKRVPPPIR